jgi:hypothetical protein
MDQKILIGFIPKIVMSMEFSKENPFSMTCEFIEQGRELFYQAFKSHIKDKKRQYYACSVGQMFAYGHERLKISQDIVNREFESLFSPYWIE